MGNLKAIIVGIAEGAVVLMGVGAVVGVLAGIGII